MAGRNERWWRGFRRIIAAHGQIMVRAPMLIRRATTSDLDAMVALLAVLFEQEDEFAPDADKQRHGLQMILDDPHCGHVLVAEEAGHVVGMSSVLFTVSTALGGRAGVLEDVVVLAEHRGRAVGSALVDAAIDAAKEAGCLRLSLVTDGSNSRAHRFYARHGFVPSDMITMRRMM